MCHLAFFPLLIADETSRVIVSTTVLFTDPPGLVRVQQFRFYRPTRTVLRALFTALGLFQLGHRLSIHTYVSIRTFARAIGQ